MQSNIRFYEHALSESECNELIRYLYKTSILTDLDYNKLKRTRALEHDIVKKLSKKYDIDFDRAFIHKKHQIFIDEIKKYQSNNQVINHIDMDIGILYNLLNDSFYNIFFELFTNQIYITNIKYLIEIVCFIIIMISISSTIFYINNIFRLKIYSSSKSPKISHETRIYNISSVVFCKKNSTALRYTT